jgi:hypothetical protein
VIGRRGALVLGLGALSWPAAAQTDRPDLVVRALYEAHRPHVEGLGRSLLTDPIARRRFFTRALGDAIARDERRAIEMGMRPRLAFDPMSGAVEPDVRELVIGEGVTEGQGSRVVASFRSHGTATTITYVLVREQGHWKIDDIRGEGAAGPWSVRGVLGLP